MKICIVKLSAMGDIIHAMVVLQFIKKKFPNSQIDWIVESGFKGVLEHNPHINNILPVNLKSMKKKKSEIFTQYKLLKKYSKNNYDIIIDAQGLLKSAIVSRIVGAKIIAGFDKDSIREKIASLFYNKTVNIPYEANTIERNMAVVCNSLHVGYTKNDILNKDKFLFFPPMEHKDETKKYIVFVVGASRENKMYPKEKFAQLANKLQQKVVIVWGNEDEKVVATWIAQNSDYAKIAPKGNLDALKNIITSSKMVIGGDTGPTHMAWGLNIPSITIFGNTPEHRNTYLTNINKVVKSSSKVNPLKLNHSDFSIRDIEVQEIIKLTKDIHANI